MKTVYNLSRFNVAPDAPQHPPRSWALLVVSIVIATACSFPLWESIQSHSNAQHARNEIDRALKKRLENHRKATAEQSNPAALRREKTQMQLQEFTQLSWDGIFDALEMAADAVHAGVSIVVLTSEKVVPDAAQIRLTALAANMPIMLAYLNALQEDPRIEQVEITSQQADDRSGPGVIRFQLNVTWNPKVVLAHAKRPRPATTPQPAKVNSIVPLSVLRDLDFKNQRESAK